MNAPDDHDEMEKLLARLAPMPPGKALMARLEAARPVPERKVIRFPIWIPLSAAAAIVVAFFWSPGFSGEGKPVSSKNPTKPGMIPVEKRQHLMEVADFGVVEDRNRKPVRLIRTTWLDEFVYTDGSTGKRMTDSRVRQEILPVSVQTF